MSRAISVLCLVAALPLLSGRPAGADPTQIATNEAELAQLETTIANEQQHSAALDAEYVAAQAQLDQIQDRLIQTRDELARTRREFAVDRRRLARDAVYAYVYDEPAARIDSLFATTPTNSVAWSQYQDAVVGNITAVLAALDLKEGRLAAVANLEQVQDQAASNALRQVHALQVANQQAAAVVQATLAQVRGTLATQVARYAEQQAEAEAAYAASHPADAGSAARNATLDASVALALGDPGAPAAVAAANAAATESGAPTVSGSTTGSSAGARAVAAAESQLGVPYVWGGETPGGGFDCSGLTQWSWAQAGVSIPRVAAEQALEVPHVPLDELEPGDLLFYYNLDGDGQIDHVVMYVGSGPYGTQTVIEAPYTGQTVRFSPLFTEGLVAAGRP
jgi:cell wall-associated NlpC family hydrolase